MHKITPCLDELNIPRHAIKEQTFLIHIRKRDTFATGRGDAGAHALGNGGVGGFVDRLGVGSRHYRFTGNGADGIGGYICCGDDGC